MTLAVGDKVRVVAPDPEVPECREYIGAEGEIIEDDPEAYGRLRYNVQISNHQERGCAVNLCFCEQELQVVEVRS